MAKTFRTDLDLNSTAQVINMPQSTAAGEAVEHLQLVDGLAAKQNTLSIGADSQDYLSIVSDELNVSNLLVNTVTVDTTNATIAAFVSANYTVGNEYQESDIIIMTSAAVGSRVYIHNGGSAGTAADFTLVDDALDAALIRSYMSGGTGITFNQTTGVISADSRRYEETNVALTAATPYTVAHGFSETPIIQVISSSSGAVVGVDIDAKTGTSGEATIMADTNITVDIIVLS